MAVGAFKPLATTDSVKPGGRVAAQAEEDNTRTAAHISPNEERTRAKRTLNETVRQVLLNDICIVSYDQNPLILSR
jgi:hypothetical protein